jgi:hypothetical protein
MKKTATLATILVLMLIGVPVSADGDKPVKAEVFIDGYCVTDQNGVGLAYMDFGPIDAAMFTINGTVYDSPPTFGVNAQFGVNVWSAVAKPGYKLKEPTSGEFVIEECGDPGTTTTTQPTTTTTVVTTTQPEATTTTGPDPTLTIPPQPTDPPVTDPPQPAETLPFTGVDPVPVGAAALGVVLLGATILVATRRGTVDD